MILVEYDTSFRVVDHHTLNMFDEMNAERETERERERERESARMCGSEVKVSYTTT